MARYKLVLEIDDIEDSSEDIIDDAIRNGLETIGVTVIDSKPFERIGEEDEKLFKELQDYVEDHDIEITFDKGTYYILHICKNNMPVPLYQTEDIHELIDLVHSNNY